MNRHGFTLLEVLVAATVISLLSGISLVGYNRFQERQQLNSAKEQLRNDLRQTQQKALSGEKPAGWCAGSGKTLTGWRLMFTSATVYEIRGICSSGAVVTDKSVILTGNASKIAGADQIDFAPLTGAAADTSFILQTNTASGNWRATVSVTSAGLVQTSAVVATTSTPAPTGGTLATPTPATQQQQQQKQQQQKQQQQKQQQQKQQQQKQQQQKQQQQKQQQQKQNFLNFFRRLFDHFF